MIIPDRRRTMRGGLLAGEVPIKKQDLRDLKTIKQAHDQYLRSVRIISTGAEQMRAEAAGGSEYAQGWMACLSLFARTITRGDGK